MIARIHGTLIETYAPFVLVDVHGVGYELQLPMSSIYKLPKNGSEVTLLTHFVVREDSQLLYGFLTKGELDMFRLLLKVNGIGAKTALSVLSSIPLDTLTEAISTQAPGLLTKIPGIGKKTAERLILELKDKISGLSVAGPSTQSKADVINALVSLGYSNREAALAAKSLPDDIDTSEGIRLALKSMVK